MSDRLAPYATRWQDSRGRLHPEPESDIRTPFQRDRDRIIHATAFRRLKHKTQVFVAPEGDHFRTRLTHSIEVAQIARTFARSLRLDEDLAEALALAHDLGHTPFGHAGEAALDAVMKPWGGFDHNDQALRVLTLLERHYAAFDGLNLTWETLEGVVKHNGPLTGPGKSAPVPQTIANYDRQHDLALGLWPGPEAQVAAIADDIAYDHHDLDDGLRAGLLDVADFDGLPHVAAAFRETAERFPGIERSRLIHETVRRLIDAMVRDVLAEAKRRLTAVPAPDVRAVRERGQPVIAFSGPMRQNDQALKDFLLENMYRDAAVVRETTEARRVVIELFEGLMAEPDLLPVDWRPAGTDRGEGALARVVADYIAGMTDRYAVQKHALLRSNHHRE